MTLKSLMRQTKEERIILGIDPGTRICGYGLIKSSDEGLKALDFGCIKPPTTYLLSDRYFILFESVLNLIEAYRPDVVALESPFVGVNPLSAIKLGMAKGALVIAAKENQLPVYEYSPCEVKNAVVGNGHASKGQIQGMVKLLLKLNTIPNPEDAADALAVAICHSFASSFQKSKEM